MTLTKDRILQILHQELPYLHQHYGVVLIGLYGSFVSGTATDKSDIDLVVELSRPLGLEFVALADHLESALGRSVDLITSETLRLSLDRPRYRPIALRIQEALTSVQVEAG